MARHEFPPGFLWGAATAAYQIEGAVGEDGRGESIWDRFSHTPGKVVQGHTGDVACDHYHRYRQDVALMAELGLRAYRFSIAWPRIFPEGGGRPNPKGLDFYRRLVDALLEANIRPMATLYHWDLPQALQDRGGWSNRDTARAFADYAATCFGALGDSVPLWVTHNEPWVVAVIGHLWGHHAPGLRHLPLALATAHHLLLSHGLAVQAFRAASLPEAGVGIVLNLSPGHPASPSAADREAAARHDAFHNRWFLDPLFRGRYPKELAPLAGEEPPAWRRDGDLAIISQPIDFLGINYYTRALLRSAPGSGPLGFEQVPGPGPRTEMGWEIYPEGLYEILTRVHRDYGPVPLYVTENGAAFADRLEGDAVADPDREAYLRDHLVQAHRALREGVPLRGYFAWSLLDNFEWAFGYTKRFGLVYVDYPTQRRIWKGSARWYRGVIEANGLQA